MENWFTGVPSNNIPSIPDEPVQKRGKSFGGPLFSIHRLCHQSIKTGGFYSLLLLFLLLFPVTILTAQKPIDKSSAQSDQYDLKYTRLKNKIVPLSNPVYQFLDYCEASCKINFLPQARPYTKVTVIKLLKEILNNNWLTEYENTNLTNYLNDLTRESNGFQIHKQEFGEAFTVVGFGAEATARTGLGTNGTWGTSLIGMPYLSGDLGQNISFHAVIGGAFERLTPDLFYRSYVKDGKVNLPYQSIGYSFLPYQFNYETLYQHIIKVKPTLEDSDNPEEQADKWSVTSNINDKKLSIGMIYYTELNANWLDGAVQLSMNNQRRAWGNDDHNLILSSTARRFPGVELKIYPASGFRYSMLVGSLFSNHSQSYTNVDIYGYDTGLLENLYALHLIEYTPWGWLQISATATNVWTKRSELSYLMPFVFTHFSQLEVGDYDNNSMSIDLAFHIPGVGKTWFSFLNDEFSFIKSGDLLKMPRNRYGWQLGFKTGLLTQFLPGTVTTLKYTRLTPFAYTHYTETRLKTYGDRPMMMTYTHDGTNLGFYLPPNSGELNWTLTNMLIPDLILTLDNKLIIHGTNDLASDNLYQIYGDINRSQLGKIYDYPLLHFGKDGLYDWTVMSDFRFDYKIRGGALDYFRITGSLGFGGTWWKSNQSGVTAPPSQALFCGSLGIVIDI
ncbi:MAG TPA: hypothetical protein PLB87_10565 [Prolixibacteraceae bacterium]|nr:hypothetical protein [Prolixibacteraceae bacterium]